MHQNAPEFEVVWTFSTGIITAVIQWYATFVMDSSCMLFSTWFGRMRVWNSQDENSSAVRWCKHCQVACRCQWIIVDPFFGSHCGFSSYSSYSSHSFHQRFCGLGHLAIWVLDYDSLCDALSCSWRSHRERTTAAPANDASARWIITACGWTTAAWMSTYVDLTGKHRF